MSAWWMLLVGVALVVATYVYVRKRDAADLASLPARELYRARFCLFVLQGYLAARAEHGEPSAHAIGKHARDFSTRAGFVPREDFVGMVAALSKITHPAACALLSDTWKTLYRKLGAEHAEQLAVERAAHFWSEREFQVGRFRPEEVWVSYPTLRPGAQYFTTRIEPRALNTPDQPIQRQDGSSVSPAMQDLMHRFAGELHKRAVELAGDALAKDLYATQQVLRDPAAIELLLEEQLNAWFAEHLRPSSDNPLARSARAFFTSNQVAGIASEKAEAVHWCAIVATGRRLALDSDASDAWIGELAVELFHQRQPRLAHVLSRVGIEDLAAAYTYQCRACGEAPESWMNTKLEALNEMSAARLQRLGLTDDDVQADAAT